MDPDADSDWEYEYDDTERNGHNAYESDAPGTNDREVLDCVVSEPLKENEGSKDTFVSYLITTNVRKLEMSCGFHPPTCSTWRFAR